VLGAPGALWVYRVRQVRQVRRVPRVRMHALNWLNVREDVSAGASQDFAM